MAVNSQYGNTAILNSTGVVLGNVYVQLENQPSADSKSKVLLDSLIFDRWDARLRNISNALSNTCQWIFSHQSFRTWLDPDTISQHGGFLWLRGKPGSGKSTIMKQALRWARREMPERLAVSYFFNARSPYELEKSSLGFYQSLTYRLLTAFPEGITLFTQMFSAKERDGKLIESWNETELQNCLFELVDAQLLPPFTIFVDALDEGEDDDVRNMIDFLVDLCWRSQSASDIIMVCLSSRHYPRITISKCVFIVLEQETEHRIDIERYVSEKLRGGSELTKCAIRRQVLNDCNGIFLWVVLVVSMLNKLKDQGLSIKSRIERLKQVPRDLHDVFYDLLYRDTEDFERSIVLLRWVLHSRRPLPPYLLCAAVEASLLSEEGLELLSELEDDEPTAGEMYRNRIISLSHGLVEFVYDTDDYIPGPTVQFIHETVRDFLLGKTEVEREQGHVSDDQGLHARFQADLSHNLIAETCLRCLSTTKGKLQASDDDYSLVWYAAHYWFEHVVQDKAGKKVLDLATDLFLTERKLLFWVRLCDIDELGRRGRRRRYANHYLDRYTLCSPLYYAAIIGFTELVVNIIDRGANVNTHGEIYQTPLQASIAWGHERIAETLLNRGAKVNVQGGYYGNALQAAAYHGNERLVVTLLDRGADINAQGGEYGNALQAASIRGHTIIVNALLDRGADVNARGRRYGTALIAASFYGHEEIVETLLDRGADVNAQEGRFDNALEAAVYRDRGRIAKILFERGAILMSSQTLMRRYGRQKLSRLSQIS